MASDHLERIWKSIIPLSSLPKTRPDPVLNASSLLLPPMTAVNPTTAMATTRRMQQELTQHRIEKLTERVDNIIEAVNQAKGSLMQTDGRLNTLMDRTLESTTILVNRTQTRILEAIGQPAQDGIMKELLESQKDILGIVGLMCQQTTSLQANLTNLQASVIALTSQTHHVSVQIASVEQRLAQKMDSVKEDIALGLEYGRKRGFPFDEQDRATNDPPSKRRKSKGAEWTLTPSRSALVAKKAQPISADPLTSSSLYNVPTGKVSSTSPLPLDRTSDEESATSPLTPFNIQERQHYPSLVERLHGIEQARVLGSTGNHVNARLTKAQRLASLLGDGDCEDENSTEDLFSGLR